MLEIGDIVEMLIPGSGCINWESGEKLEIVGTGRENIYYARFLSAHTLLELKDDEEKYFKKVEGSKIYK